MSVKDEDIKIEWPRVCGFIHDTTHHNDGTLKRKHDDISKINDITSNNHKDVLQISDKDKVIITNDVTQPTNKLEGDLLIENEDLNIHTGWRSTRIKQPIDRLTYAHVVELVNT